MVETRLQLLAALRQQWSRGEQAAALAGYQDLLQQFPEDALGWREYGRALFALQCEEEQAVRVFEYAYELEPTSVITHLYLGALYELGYGKGILRR